MPDAKKQNSRLTAAFGIAVSLFLFSSTMRDFTPAAAVSSLAVPFLFFLTGRASRIPDGWRSFAGQLRRDLFLLLLPAWGATALDHLIRFLLSGQHTAAGAAAGLRGFALCILYAAPNGAEGIPGMSFVWILFALFMLRQILRLAFLLFKKKRICLPLLAAAGIAGLCLMQARIVPVLCLDIVLASLLYAAGGIAAGALRGRVHAAALRKNAVRNILGAAVCAGAAAVLLILLWRADLIFDMAKRLWHGHLPGGVAAHACGILLLCGITVFLSRARFPRGFFGLFGRHIPLLLLLAVFSGHFRFLWGASRPVTAGILRAVFVLAAAQILLLAVSRWKKIPSAQPDRAFALRWTGLFDILYYIAFAWCLFILFLNTSTIAQTVDTWNWGWLFSAYRVLPAVMLLFAFSVVRTKDRRILLLQILLLLTALFYGRNGGSMEVICLCVLMTGAANRSFRVILWEYLVIGITLLVLCWALSMNGIFVNLVYTGSGFVRHAFGICYPTDHAAHVLMLLMAYCMLRPRLRKWYGFIDLIPLFGIIFLLYRYTHARAACACALLAASVTLVYQLCACIRNPLPAQVKNMRHSAHAAFAPVFVYCFFVMLFLTAVYSGEKYKAGTAVLESADTLETFWARLFYGKEALRLYPLRLFGNAVAERGNGGSLTHRLQNSYFFLDSSYIRMLVIYGLLFTAVFLLIMTVLQFRMLRKKQYYLMALLCVVALSGLLEHHLTDVSYNVFALMAFACVPRPDDA